MKTKVNKGLRLGVSETAANCSGAVVLSLSALLMYFALTVILAEMCGMGSIAFYASAAAVGVVLAVAECVLSILKKDKLFYIGSLLLIFVLVVAFRGKILDGARLLINSFCDTYLINNGIVLQKLQTASSGAETLCAVLFSQDIQIRPFCALHGFSETAVKGGLKFQFFTLLLLLSLDILLLLLFFLMSLFHHISCLLQILFHLMLLILFHQILLLL